MTKKTSAARHTSDSTSLMIDAALTLAAREGGAEPAQEQRPDAAEAPAAAEAGLGAQGPRAAQGGQAAPGAQHGRREGRARRARPAPADAAALQRQPPHRPAPARQIVFHREDGRRCILDQRIPFRAVGTLALPAVRDTATGLADIAFLRLGHAAS